MKPHEADRLIGAIKELLDDAPALHGGRRAGKTALHGRPLDDNGATEFRGPPVNGETALGADAFEQLYRKIKNRLTDELRVDPTLLKLLTLQPEIVVECEPRVVILEGTSLKGRVASMIACGWFESKRTTGGVRVELTRTGKDPGGGGTLSDQLKALQSDGFLTNESGGWIAAPGVKVTKKTIETV